MKSVGTWLAAAEKRLKAAGIPSARLDSELLLAHALGRTRVWLKARPEHEVSHQQLLTADSLLARRLQREPLAYITGSKEFYGRHFSVNHDVLIPRPESEALIGLALGCGLPKGAAVMDVGTGSGCLGVTLALELTGSRVTLLDISQTALETARLNAEQLGATIAYLEADILTLERTLDIPHAPFDLIIANLPYVDASWECSPETTHEPALALYSGANGLWHYMHLMTAALHFLKADGRLIIEADPRQQDELLGLADKIGYELVVQQDLALLFVRKQISRELPDAPGIIKLFPR